MFSLAQKPARKSRLLRLACVSLVAALPAVASSQGASAQSSPEEFFVPVGTFDVIAGNGSAVAEIIDVTTDGSTLIYTDADSEQIGFVDISDPAAPTGTGVVDVGGEPTSLVVIDEYVVVAVNTSPDFVNPSGEVVIVELASRSIVATVQLGGQPDSIALSPSGNFLALVLENERDEDLGDGFIPQNKTGELLIADLTNPPAMLVSRADLTPVANDAFAGSDLEPEFVDINDDDLAVVTFQENNHLAVVDLATATTISQFSAGEVTLTGVDTVEEDLILLDSTIVKRREPDAVAWIDSDTFATANEGDYTDAADEEGGSRGFTLFNIDGTVEYESAESFEHLLVSVGHYPEGRSENKGVEPESAESATFGDRDLLFIGSERGNAVGVFDVTSGTPSLVQALPTGIGPEGLKAIPDRSLFAVSTEADVEDAGIPTMINLYSLEADAPTYPSIISGPDPDTAGATPVPWTALSGMAADTTDPSKLYAVSDSFLAAGYIYTIDATPSGASGAATITSRTEVTGASESLDLEGIAVAENGNFWLASEGRSDGSSPNLIVETDASGAVQREVALPAEFDDIRNNGFEGIALSGDIAGTPEYVYVAIQRAWPEEGDTDAVNTKIGRYDVAADAWTFVHYALEAEGDGDWVGLSELTALPDGRFAVIERDKGWGPTTAPNADLKAVYVVDLANASFAAYQDGIADGGLTTISKTLLVDLLPAIAERSIWTAEKLEGLAVAADGQVYAVTDNDGVDDATGETIFLRVGDIDGLIGPDPEIPEAPLVAMMSASAILAIGAGALLARRRQPAMR